MTRQIFIKELEEVDNDVIKMGSILEQSLNEMITALDNLDIVKANQIIEKDNDIDILEQRIERECINIIAKQQPLATDLRRITSIMKIITDLERIADHCADISEYIITLNKLPESKAPEHICDMIKAMKKMVVNSIDSFVTSDLKKASDTINADDVVDNYFKSISDELTKTMQKDSEQVKQSVCYLMIIKYLERMADHATNISEWIIFIVTGDLVLS